MNAKKSFSTAVLAALLLSGCGSSSAAAAAPSASAAPEPTPTATPEETAVVSQADNYKSVWEGSTCSNYWNNVVFTMPDGWYQLTEDQIAQVTGAGTDAISNDLSIDKDQIVSQQSATCNDFYISNAAGTATFYSEIIDREALGLPNLTPEQYLQQTKAVLESMTTISAGCDEIVDNTMGQNEGKSMNVTIKDANGSTAAIESMFVNERDGMLVSYIATAMDQDGVSQLQGILEQIG